MYRNDYIVFETDNLPDHKSPYYNPSDALYEEYNGNNSNYSQNPNRIKKQNTITIILVYKIMMVVVIVYFIQ